jgi:hypothetical protein
VCVIPSTKILNINEEIVEGKERYHEGCFKRIGMRSYHKISMYQREDMFFWKVWKIYINYNGNHELDHHIKINIMV